VSSWRNKFAKGAVDYLSKVLFPQLPENTKEHRAVWCTWAISGSDRQQPYYYLAYEDAEEGSGGDPVTKVCHTCFTSGLTVLIKRLVSGYISVSYRFGSTWPALFKYISDKPCCALHKQTYRCPGPYHTSRKLS
jgi:hypothetical protein